MYQLTDEDLKILSRDYSKHKLKRGEVIPREDLYYLYITLNRSIADVAEIFNRCNDFIRCILKKYIIIKDSSKIFDQKVRDYKQSHGQTFHQKRTDVAIDKLVSKITKQDLYHLFITENKTIGYIRYKLNQINI